MIREIWNRLRKRQAPTLEVSFPLGSGAPLYGDAEKIPCVRRALSLYVSFLNSLCLEPKDHPFAKLIESGGFSAFHKIDFYGWLVREFFLNGQAIARLKFDRETGRVQEILPYRNNSARGYVQRGDYSDPESVAAGYFYRSNYNGRVFWPDEALVCKDYLSSSDLVNSLPRAWFFKVAFDSGIAIQSSLQGLSQSSGRGAVLLSGLSARDSEQDKKTRERIRTLVQMGLKAENQVLTLPAGYEAKQFVNQNGYSIMQFLSERNDEEIARIFDVPLGLLTAGKMAIQPLKELWRSWIKITLRAFCERVAMSFSKACGDGTEFHFKISKLLASDLRESSQFLSQLTQSGILSTDEAAAMIEDTK